MEDHGPTTKFKDSPQTLLNHSAHNMVVTMLGLQTVLILRLILHWPKLARTGLDGIHTVLTGMHTKMEATKMHLSMPLTPFQLCLIDLQGLTMHQLQMVF